jgi:hypothetical protein
MRRIGRNSFTEIYFAGCNPGFVETQVERGVGPEEILQEGVPVTRQDPYPIGQRLFIHDERLTGLIVHNLHARILERKTAAHAG